MKIFYNLLLFIALSGVSCKEQIDTPENYTITNDGLPPIKSDTYFIADLKTVENLASGGTKNSTILNQKFNIAQFESKTLSLFFTDLCIVVGNGNVIQVVKNYKCDSYTFSNISTHSCK